MPQQLRTAMAAGLVLLLAYTADSGSGVRSDPKQSAGDASPRRYSVTRITGPDVGVQVEGLYTRMNSSGEFFLNFQPYSPPESPLLNKTYWNHAYLYSYGKLMRLPTLGGESNSAQAINEKGEVIGSSETGEMYSDPFYPRSSLAARHVFLYSHGRMSDLGTFGGHNSDAVGFNNKGEIVGAAQRADGTRHAFLFRQGRMLDLGTLGGQNSSAISMNNKGEVVGNSDTANDEKHAFLYHNDRMIDLGTLGGKAIFGNPTRVVHINERGEVTGQSLTRTGETHAFIYHQGRMRDLGSPISAVKIRTYADVMNNRGEIIGRWDAAGGGGSFLYSHGVMKSLGELRTAIDINNVGQVVGWIGVANPRRAEEHPFLYDKGEFIDLLDCCPGYTSNEISQAVQINDRGQILARGGRPFQYYLLTPR